MTIRSDDILIDPGYRRSIRCALKRHTKKVRDNIDSGKVLIWNVENDGWSPLCDFLDTTEPQWPLPSIGIRKTLLALTARLH